jgi:hypothetical protein
MSEYSKKGAVKLTPAECAPMSLHNKSLPGGDVGTAPQSFHTNKAGAMGGENRPEGYRADEKLRAA